MLAQSLEFISQACVGLVNQIELGDLKSEKILDLLRLYVHPLLAQNVDTIVLGCTHYPFVVPQIDQVIQEYFAGDSKRQIHIIDTGEAVARRLKQQLLDSNLLSKCKDSSLVSYTTGSVDTLQLALNFNHNSTCVFEIQKIII